MSDMEKNELRISLDNVLVDMHADRQTWNAVGKLPPRLWEALRLELQARYRIATGEEFAVLIIEGDGHE